MNKPNTFDHVWHSKVRNIVSVLIACIVAPIALFLIYVLLMSSTQSPSSIGSLVAYAESIRQAHMIFIVISIIVILGLFIWYCMALSDFSSIQKTPQDTENASKILQGILISTLGVIGVVLLNIVIVRMGNLKLIQSMLFLTPFIILGIQCTGIGITMGAYKRLSESSTFNEWCQEGFDDLRISMVLSLIATLIGFLSDFLPHQLTIIVSLAIIVLAIISIVKTFSGWSKVKNNSPYL